MIRNDFDCCFADPTDIEIDSTLFREGTNHFFVTFELEDGSTISSIPLGVHVPSRPVTGISN